MFFHEFFKKRFLKECAIAKIRFLKEKDFKKKNPEF